jgi:hypothetical protein
MTRVTTTTFLVSDVRPATTLLPEVPYKEAVESLLKSAASNRRSRPVEACARYHGKLLAGVPFHPVVAAAHRAFMDHRPLCLSPDIIWLLICQGVANHINVHAQELRSRFVAHEGKMQISVRRDDFVKGSPENPWAEIIEALTSEVREHIGSAYDLFEPAFTTTGPVERAAAGIVLLDAMQSYFDYDMDTLCGIPAITLEGTPEDWQAVADRALQFKALDLEWWLAPLRALLQQFVAASQGVVDRSFWQSFYKYHEESGGPMITGWISALFPYLNDERTGLATSRNRWLAPDSQIIEDEIDDIDVDYDIEIDYEVVDIFDALRIDKEDEQDIDEDEQHIDDASKDKQMSHALNADADAGDDFDLDDDRELVIGAWLRPMPRRKQLGEENDLGSGWGPSISSLPLGLSRAPFRWDYLKQSFDMELLGGFVGVSQDKETLAVRPEIGWAVREAPAVRSERT